MAERLAASTQEYLDNLQKTRVLHAQQGQTEEWVWCYLEFDGFWLAVHPGLPSLGQAVLHNLFNAYIAGHMPEALADVPLALRAEALAAGLIRLSCHRPTLAHHISGGARVLSTQAQGYENNEAELNRAIEGALSGARAAASGTRTPDFADEVRMLQSILFPRHPAAA